MKKRTYVYIDGFNLYYGAVKGTRFKWLDLVAFSKRLMAGYNVEKVKYFTAKVLPLDDPNAPSRQEIFWRAHRSLYDDIFEIIEGHFRIDPRLMRKAVKSKDGNYCASDDRIMVMRPEEKGTDVNLAVHLLNDAWHDRYDVALVLSNDSDLVEAIRIVKIELHKTMVLANPFIGFQKKTARELMALKLEKRKIRKIQLSDCQLPDKIPGTRIRKPDIW